MNPVIGYASEWIKLLRVHQWSKNALVFVPLVTAQKLDFASLYQASGAFLFFSLAASAGYILNDVVDLDADRKHASKKNRPLATGSISQTASIVFFASFADS